jgi:hypothetical protein
MTPNPSGQIKASYGAVDLSPQAIRGSRLRRHIRRTGSSDPKDFGTWKLLSTSQRLVLKREDWREVHLGACDSPAQILDWIFHNLTKHLTDKEVADMLYAIEVILRPCRNYCSSGANKRASGRQLVKAYLAESKS